MDPALVADLAQSIIDDLTDTPSAARLLIGIAGVPGSGKTTLAAAVAAAVNSLSPASCPLAVVVPMDGFHYSRARLATMPDPAEAIARRGAAFTFDADGFLALIHRLAGSLDAVLAPSFAHEIRDPVPGAISVPAGSRVVLVEGNYCALDRPVWRDAAAAFTRIWYVDVPPEVAQARLARRHLAAGIVRDEAEAWERASGSDELNARDIRENLLRVDRVIEGW